MTRTVPAAVPSLLQSSRPAVPSVAAKRSVPEKSVSSSGAALTPASKEETWELPLAVPSVL
jgi:hypothetical protein